MKLRMNEDKSDGDLSSRITLETIAAHGLSASEYNKVLEIMGREPNLTELGIFSVMWSEHCSYKSSKYWLKTLPTEAPWVICGPGENAGIIDIGDGQAAVFKMESHNHPSFIEPFQGAATGVGGILRDIFTMGARPVANMNSLRFGRPDHPKTKHLVNGVVAGIGSYGNCVGVPTLGGECTFHMAYDGNILVNAMTVGIAETNKIFYSAATGAGNPVIYVGSKTGRDGIHGATMASAEFTEGTEEKRPTVQVGDPFTEKLLIEACLELMQMDCIVGIQDMGAAGLTSSSFEMASKGGMGVELNLDDVPQREKDMTPYEMMLSESQERMLMVLKPGSEEAARTIFEKWALDFAIVGKLTNTGRMVLNHKSKKVADLPIDPLALASPEYDENDRPWTPTQKSPPVKPDSFPAPDNPLLTLKKIMGTPDLASKRWVWEQYDHMVMADTLVNGRPGGDAALVRVHGTKKALAITTDCTPRYCQADPVEGGRQAVAETWRNITATGAKPLAITDCMNFGNPERPDVMGQFVGSIQGMREACLILKFPVVSGNVSLYNETNGQAIMPTPAIGGVGLIEDYTKAVSLHLNGAGQTLILVGQTQGHIGQSLYLREIHGLETGPPPSVDLSKELQHGNFVRSQIGLGNINACHDISDGGLAVAVTEMAMAGNIGVNLNAEAAGSMPLHAWLFGEDQARFLIATNVPERIMDAAKLSKVPASIIGESKGNEITIAGFSIPLSDIIKEHENWLPEFMSTG